MGRAGSGARLLAGVAVAVLALPAHAGADGELDSGFGTGGSVATSFGQRPQCRWDLFGDSRGGRADPHRRDCRRQRDRAEPVPDERDVRPELRPRVRAAVRADARRSTPAGRRPQGLGAGSPSRARGPGPAGWRPRSTASQSGSPPRESSTQRSATTPRTRRATGSFGSTSAPRTSPPGWRSTPRGGRCSPGAPGPTSSGCRTTPTSPASVRTAPPTRVGTARASWCSTSAWTTEPPT